MSLGGPEIIRSSILRILRDSEVRGIVLIRNSVCGATAIRRHPKYVYYTCGLVFCFFGFLGSRCLLMSSTGCSRSNAVFIAQKTNKQNVSALSIHMTNVVYLCLCVSLSGGSLSCCTCCYTQGTHTRLWSV